MDRKPPETTETGVQAGGTLETKVAPYVGSEPKFRNRFSTYEGGLVLSSSRVAEDTTCCGNIECVPRIIREKIVTDYLLKKKCILKWGTLFWFFTNVFFGLVFWGVLILLVGKDYMYPGKPVFNLFLLYVFAYVLGWSLTYIPRLHLPPLVGMLSAGLLVRNVEINGRSLWTTVDNVTNDQWMKLRNFCIVFIMMRCGLQLNATSLREHKKTILLIAYIPCTIEMIVVTMSANAILDYPWDWSFLCGSICSTMSPVVTVHCILVLEEKGYGGALINIICASTAIDSTHIVTLYSIFYAFVMGDPGGAVMITGLKTAYNSILVGICLGITLGIVCIFFPHRSEPHVFRYRAMLLTFASLLASAIGYRLKVAGGGFLAIILICFVSSTGWRMIAKHYNATIIRTYVAFVWHFTQPLIMATIGVEIEFKKWDPDRVFLYITCIMFGICARCITAMVVTIGQGFDKRERAFVALTSVPKGTVQAALAPMAHQKAVTVLEELDKRLIDAIKSLTREPMTYDDKVKLAKERIDYDVLSLTMKRNIILGRDMMRMSLVSILMLAPIGAILMMNCGPHLLKLTKRKSTSPSTQTNMSRGVSEMTVAGAPFERSTNTK